MTNITFSQVQKSFHKKLVLDIPDFQADSGEIFSIVGGNGAGKVGNFYQALGRDFFAG